MKRKCNSSRLVPPFLLLFSSLLLVPDTVFSQPSLNNASSPVISFRGLAYGPHRDNENPDFGIQPTRDELAEDLIFVEKFNAPIRTYGITDNLEFIPVLAEQHGIDNYPGAWISRFPCENERQIENLVHVANQGLSHVKGLIVGNEVLLRKDISEDQLLEFIVRVKDATDLPVATAEIVGDWLNHPRLAEAVDIMFVHIYPFWDGVAIENAAQYTLDRWNDLKARYPGKAMVIGETGWPSAGNPLGNAIPSPENQRRFLTDFVAMAEANDIDYFYFEIFDEKWKTAEGSIGTAWGMYNSHGQLKDHLVDLMPLEVRDGIERPPRIVQPTKARLPQYIYSDGCADNNRFFASGWMGELADIALNDSTSGFGDIIDESSTDNPHSGNTSIRISYSPSMGEWGGIYWQYPVNNWGNYPGYDFSDVLDISDAIQLTFWARGHSGGEKAEFVTGGIISSSLPFHDSYGPIRTQVLTLTTDWQEYSLTLTAQDLSMVIGGFGWITSYNQNPNGSTIYLDDIQLVRVQSNSLKDSSAQPKGYLRPNYPNPFNQSTTISYSLDASAAVTISIYNAIGRQVAMFVQQNPPGVHSIEWHGDDFNGNPLPSGIYYYRIMENHQPIASDSMILIR